RVDPNAVGQGESGEQSDEKNEKHDADIEDKGSDKKDSKEEVKEDEEDKNSDEDKAQDEVDDEKGEANVEASEPAKVKLYFSDDAAMYLNAEERELDELTIESVIDALIDGPKDDANRKTIPDGTKLIDAKIEDGVAYINFSKDIVEKHWGGSTGEMHTIYSIVNTLTLDPNLGIDSVKFLVEGKSIESLAGHMDLADSFKTNLDLLEQE
ncbi:MAG: GerMN domain-containing protein, partial [Clostridiales bacterium]|nr:GerMN domain-containing protein [Clostridiales bacterium]